MENIKKAANIIKEAQHLVAFTGAGISVESGIPPFRGPGGLWSKYDPSILDLNRYLIEPELSWPVINELFYEFFAAAKPNAAHFFLAELEKKGLLNSVITQNIDNLHQEAGSKHVIEYHGSSSQFTCLQCGRLYSVEELTLTDDPPKCEDDGFLLKPGFVFFGEEIPQKAAGASMAEAENADVMLVIGTTGEVMPASMIPKMAKNSGCKIIEINPVKSNYTDTISDIFLQGKAGEICDTLLKLL